MVPGERIDTRNSHGTGCSLSSAMATVQARVGDWEAALREVKPWLLGALREASALDVGTGNGPVHHFHHLQGPTRGHRWPARPRRRASSPRPCARAPRKTSTPSTPWTSSADLADGTLPEHEFAYYLAQDAIYLNGYSRVLARAAALAPTEAEQLFWARSAQTCLEVESELHRSWLSTRPAATALGPVTKSYVDHLLAASVSGSYAVLVAAVLPCFWLYAEVGSDPAPAVPGRRRPGDAPLRRVAADLRRRGLRRRHPAGHRVHGRGGPAGLRRANGRPWPWPSGSPRATKWTSSTRRGCTPDRGGPRSR